MNITHSHTHGGPTNEDHGPKSAFRDKFGGNVGPVKPNARTESKEERDCDYNKKNNVYDYTRDHIMKKRISCSDHIMKKRISCSAKLAEITTIPRKKESTYSKQERPIAEDT